LIILRFGETGKMKRGGLEPESMSRRPSYVNSTKEELKELEQALRNTAKAGQIKYRRRLQAIWYSFKGWSVERIAKYCEISESKIWQWRKTYKEEGIEGLKGKYQ
jgi:transposase